MAIEKKHLHVVYLCDKDWNRVAELSQEQNTSKSDALSFMINRPEPKESQSKYEQLLSSLQIISELVEQTKPPLSVTFRECAGLYLDEQRRQNKSSTVRTHKAPLNSRLLQRFGDRLMCDITRQDLVDYIDSLAAEGLSPSYINQILGTIKQIFRTALLNGYIEKDVSENVRRLPEKRSIARATYHRALDKARELDLFLKELAHEHLYLFIMFMLCTATRQGEASALTAEDISFDEEYIYIRRTMITDENNHVIMGESTKTPSGVRKIPINAKLEEILRQIDLPTDGSTIFKSSCGKPVSNSAVNRAIRDTIKRVKEKYGVEIEHFTSHALRDTFATYYAEANADKGGDLKTLQEIMGHAKLAVTTDLYLHATDSSKVEGMRRYGSFI